MQRVRVGILGSGFMGRTQAEAIRKWVSNAELIAVAGGTRAPQLAKDYEIDLEKTVGALLARDDIDAIIVTTPHAVHAEQAILAAENGKHILMDKPMATTVEDCNAMIEACDAAGVNLMVGQTQRFRVVNATAKKLIDEGRIGRVLMMRETQIETGGLENLPPWQSLPENVGLLLAHGVHNLDRMRWLIGDEAAQVTAHSGSYREETAVELSSMSLFRFRSGAVGSLWCEWECPAPGFPKASSSAWIMGEDGVLDLDAYGQLRLGIEGSWTIVCEQAPIDWRGKGMLDPIRMKAYQLQGQEFVDSILDGRPPSVTGEEGRAAVEMALAAYRSSDTGQMIRLPLGRD